MTRYIFAFLAFMLTLAGFFWWRSYNRAESRTGAVMTATGGLALVLISLLWRPR